MPQEIDWTQFERYNLSPREEFEIAKGKDVTEILHERARVEEAQRRMGLGDEIDDLRRMLAALCESLLDLETRTRDLERAKMSESRLTTIELEIAELRDRFDRMEALQPPSLLYGLLPPLASVSLLELQIFYTPVLTANQRRGRNTHWSIKLDVYIKRRKVRQPVHISLYNPREFAEQVFDTTADIPDTIKDVAEHMRDQSPTDILCGMLKMLTDGEGTPRSRKQFIAVQGYDGGAPEAYLAVDGEVAKFTEFRPGKGKKATRAKWYAQWRPDSMAATTTPTL
jgi:hypothetical protein